MYTPFRTMGKDSETERWPGPEESWICRQNGRPCMMSIGMVVYGRYEYGSNFIKFDYHNI